jgi:hypothetical protein
MHIIRNLIVPVLGLGLIGHYLNNHQMNQYEYMTSIVELTIDDRYMHYFKKRNKLKINKKLFSYQFDIIHIIGAEVDFFENGTRTGSNNLSR